MDITQTDSYVLCTLSHKVKNIFLKGLYHYKTFIKLNLYDVIFRDV